MLGSGPVAVKADRIGPGRVIHLPHTLGGPLRNTNGGVVFDHRDGKES